MLTKYVQARHSLNKTLSALLHLPRLAEVQLPPLHLALPQTFGTEPLDGCLCALLISCCHVNLRATAREVSNDCEP